MRCPRLPTGVSRLYLEAMEQRRGTAYRSWCAAALLSGLISAAPGAAQQTADDAAAREYFERGRSSFEQADYEGALVYFRHAYRLSGRGELQYNIGVAADRLQREEEALEAFRRYLEETESPAREIEVRERIHALEESIAERKATERALEEAALTYQAQPQTDRARRMPTSTIAGASALAAVGAAGIVAMGVGLGKDGSCKREVAAACVTESSATAWTWVYGGIGIAALAGSATWFAVSSKRTKERRRTQVLLSPTGVVVTGRF